MRISRLVPIALVSATAFVATSAAAVAPSRTSTLPDQSLRSSQPTIADDHDIRLGSIGSGMFRARTDEPNVYFMVTDRGPNGNPSATGHRTFPVPDFDPMIVKVRTLGEQIQILQQIPLKTTAGAPVSGLPNAASVSSPLSATAPQPDEVPYNFDDSAPLGPDGYNVNGLDTEDIVRVSDGSFYLVEEYRPSVLHVAADGTILDRFVPVGTDDELAGAGYPVHATLPARYAYRRPNRGFEGLALAPDGSALFVALQSPLQLPGTGNTNTGRDSRNTRIVKLDLNGNVLGEYVYRFDVSTTFDPNPCGSLATAARARDMKVSGLYAISATQLLVLERTDCVAKVYLVDVSTGATDLTTWTPPAALPNRTDLNVVEQQNSDAQLSAAQLTPLAKTLIVDLDTVDGMPGKIESIIVVSPSELAVANDNDFGLTDFPAWDANGNLTNDTLVKSRILYVDLPAPLPR